MSVAAPVILDTPWQVNLKRGALLLLTHRSGAYQVSLFYIGSDPDGRRVKRSTGAGPTLADALRDAFHGTLFSRDLDEVERYLRASYRGGELP